MVEGIVHWRPVDELVGPGQEHPRAVDRLSVAGEPRRTQGRREAAQLGEGLRGEPKAREDQEQRDELVTQGEGLSEGGRGPGLLAGGVVHEGPLDDPWKIISNCFISDNRISPSSSIAGDTQPEVALFDELEDLESEPARFRAKIPHLGA